MAHKLTPPNFRKFNGLRFERGGGMEKSDAVAFAKRVREAGRLARVVKFQRPDRRVFYYVYTRNK